jgi:hypothetical protein
MILSVRVNETTLSVALADGRKVSAPIGWYPRLSRGTQEVRNSWRLTPQGQGIHWPDLDEDIRLEDLLAGRMSGECQASFKNWLGQRPVA